MHNQEILVGSYFFIFSTCFAHVLLTKYAKTNRVDCSVDNYSNGNIPFYEEGVGWILSAIFEGD